MNAKMFWELIENTRTKVKLFDDEDYLAFQNELITRLAKMEVDEIIKWHQIFFEYHKLAYKKKVWAAAYVINGGCSDDWFDYFRAWLIAQGHSVFMRTLRSPDSLSDVEEACENETFFEEMLSVSLLAFQRKKGCTGQLNSFEYDCDLFEAELRCSYLSDEEKLLIASEPIFDDEIDKEWSEDDLKSLVPKLCNKFDW